MLNATFKMIVTAESHCVAAKALRSLFSVSEQNKYLSLKRKKNGLSAVKQFVLALMPQSWDIAHVFPSAVSSSPPTPHPQ